MEENKNNTSEPVDIKTEEKEGLSKTQIINLDKIKCPDVDIEKEKNGVDCAALVEEKRTKLFKKYQANRKFSNIIMVAVVACLILSFVFIAQKNQAMNIAGFIVMGVTVVGLLSYYIATKNKFPNQTKEYISEISMLMNEHVFKDDRFKRMITNAQTKIALEDIIADKVYDSPTDIGSRNVCEGHFNDSRFKVAEVALYKVKNRKERDTLFVGKYISLDNDLKLDGRVIINLKGEKGLDVPTDINDLTKVEEDGNWSVYANEGFQLNSILTSKTISRIKKMKIVNNLLNVNICLWGGHTAVYLSYDDPVISLPFDKPFEAAGLDQYRDNLVEVLSALTER